MLVIVHAANTARQWYVKTVYSYDTLVYLTTLNYFRGDISEEQFECDHPRPAGAVRQRGGPQPETRVQQQYQ